MKKYMPLSGMQPKKILNIPKICPIILSSPKQNFIKKPPVVIDILHFAAHIQKLRKIQKIDL
jgi:hypothetical protein